MKWEWDIHPELIIPEIPATSASSFQLKGETTQCFWLLDQGANENLLSVPLLIRSGSVGAQTSTYMSAVSKGVQDIRPILKQLRQIYEAFNG